MRPPSWLLQRKVLRQISESEILMAESNKHTITSEFEVKMRQVLKSNFNEKCAKMELR